MRRRELVMLLGGAAALLPARARAQGTAPARLELGLTIPTSILARADEVIE